MQPPAGQPNERAVRPAGAGGFWNLADREPESEAVIDPDGTTLSFGELARLANRISNGLRTAGVSEGDTVAVALANSHRFFAALLACQQIGVYFTPLNWHLQPHESAYVLADSDARVLLVDPRFAASFEGLDPLRPAHRYCWDDVTSVDGLEPIARLLDGQPDTPPAARSTGEIALYTSGTTGRPKGVRRPLRGGDPTEATERSTAFARAFGLDPVGGSHLVTGPLYHAGPMSFSLGSLHVGHRQVLMDKWDAEDTLRLVQHHRVTDSHLVATMFNRLLDLPGPVRARYDVSSLRMIVHSAAPTAPTVKLAMMRWFGPVIWETYGGTEGAATIATPEQWLAHPGTVGRAVRGVSLAILDDDGHECPTGVDGAIYLRTRSGFAYHGDPDQTREAHRGDYFTLGDIGHLDADGFLFLTDRQKDLIISGGVNISPAEVEAVLQAHGAVADVAVIGVPNAEWGEEVKAVVELAPGFAPSPELGREIVEFARGHLAHFKCPRSVDFDDHLPRTDAGKLYKRRLRERYWVDAPGRI